MVDTTHTYVIVGAGPAGLQLSYYLQQQGADYLTLERGAEPGGFFRRFPRHRRLISLNKVHTDSTDPEIRLRWDWNSLLNDDPELLFPKFSQEYLPAADDLVSYLAEFQRVHQLRVRYGTTVEQISRDDEGFVVRTDRGVVRARCLIVATGWGRPFVPDIKGIEYATGYEEMDVDPDRYAGKRVLIIGKGNSAFETASAILGKASMVHLASRQPLRLAWNTKHPGDVRGQYGAILDSYQFKTLHSVLDCTIDEIRPVDGRFQVAITYTHAQGETAELDYHEVLRCTGFRMDTSLFDASCAPDMVRDGRMPGLRPDWQSSNVDDLYFAGTIAQARDVKHASSPFIDGFRYNLRTFTRLLRERYDDVPVPVATTPGEPASLTKVMLDRVNWSSALWTQFEYLCDVFVRDDATGDFRHYEDLPEDYAVQRFAAASHLYTLALRWGRDDYGDVFAIDRHPTPDRARESAFIHPVIRRYRHGELVAEQHLLEDLLAEWRRPDRHVDPLVEFLTGDLTGGS
ncbi:NAD(P)-binding domain-containing protein [Micromonospora antibiotica]|uniref:NAD(P)-binding domain-containing protein n=1 Tax=Micromonospora antibiotica TaxID=2807623 RepID=A0ABS3V4I0_9ACTN|nr:NAD(P)-binding domain-containing protein [Micromonospora antibiotica]MBO4160522.1 NAD(P)-binding domain-containing protein [Micromonospora antibiotica]